MGPSPQTIAGYRGVNLLPTITIPPGKYRIAVRVEGYVTFDLFNGRDVIALRAGPGGMPGYERWNPSSLFRTLVAQVHLAPPAYVTKDLFKNYPGWHAIPLHPDANYPDSSVFIGETVFEPKVPYVVVVDRYGAEFADGRPTVNHAIVLNMRSDQRLTVTVTPLSDTPQMGVVCRNSSGASAVPRGSDVTCTASGFPAGKDLDWKFVADADPNAPLTETRTAPEWRGTMVATGTVSVQERGGTLTASTRVVVSARTWPRFRIHGVNQGHGGETIDPWKQDDRPQRAGHLGHAHHPEMPAVLDAEQIADGPNRGYWYLRSFPAELISIIHMSRAWKSGHPFREMQRYGAVLDSTGNAVLDVTGTPTVYCRKHQLSGMEQLGLRHELEHVRQMDGFWRAHSPITELESAVRTSAQVGASPFADYVREQMFLKPNAALSQGDRRWQHVPQGRVPLVNFSCQLRYYP